MFLINIIILPVLVKAESPQLSEYKIRPRSSIPTGSEIVEVYRRYREQQVFSYMQDQNNLGTYQIFWITKTLKATTSTRYRTIGWQITLDGSDVIASGPKYFYTRIKIPQAYAEYTTTENGKQYVYSVWVVDLIVDMKGYNERANYALLNRLINEYKNKKFDIYVKDEDTQKKFLVKGVDPKTAILYIFMNEKKVYVDSIMTVVQGTKQLGDMDVYGNLSGVVYLTGYGAKQTFATTHPLYNATQNVIPSNVHPNWASQVMQDKGIASYTSWIDEATAFRSYYNKIFTFSDVPVVKIYVNKIYKNADGTETESAPQEIVDYTTYPTQQNIQTPSNVSYNGKNYALDSSVFTYDLLKITTGTPIKGAQTGDKQKTTWTFTPPAMTTGSYSITFYYKEVPSTKHTVLQHIVYLDDKGNKTGQTDRTVGTDFIPATQQSASKQVSIPSVPTGYKVKEIYYVVDLNSTKYAYTTSYVSSINVQYVLDGKNHQYNVWVYFQKTLSSTQQGQITFTPYSSYNMTPNREGWVNRDINVRVDIVGEQQKIAYGTENRSYCYTYTYEESYTTICYDAEGNPYTCVKTRTQTGQSCSTSPCTFKQVWQYDQIKVTGQGENAYGITTQLPTQYLQSGGYYVISGEYDNIKLHAEITKWKSISKEFICGSAPNNGWWTQSTPNTDTVAPTDTYASDSGIYRLDKTTPQYHLADGVAQNCNWTNEGYWFEVVATDNLSGFYAPNSYIQVEDRSYLHRDTSDLTMGYFDQFTNDFVFAALYDDGIYYITHKIEDYAMNVCNPVVYGPYKIDMTLPNRAQFKERTREGLDQPVSIEVTIGDNLSGIQEVRYLFTHTPKQPDKGQMIPYSIQTSENSKETKTLLLSQNQPGIWYLHIYQRDRAGNERIDTSEKIIYMPIQIVQSNFTFARGERGDVIVAVKGIDKDNQEEIQNFMIYIEGAGWINNSIDEKDTFGNYSVSLADDWAIMSYWKTENDTLYYYLPVIPPFGTPLTINKGGNRIRSAYEYRIWYEYVGSFERQRSEEIGGEEFVDSEEIGEEEVVDSEEIASKPTVSTKNSKITIDIVHEMEIKTEIFNNSY